jgi:hypothetical protein
MGEKLSGYLDIALFRKGSGLIFQRRAPAWFRRSF